MQLKHDPNAVVKKKLVKAGKKWVVVSTLSFAGMLLGGAVTGLDVHADVVGTSDTANADQTATNNSDSTRNEAKSVTANVTVSSNLGDVTVTNVTGTVGQTVTITVPAKAGYKADKSMIVANVNADGTITTDETIDYTSTEAPDVQSGTENNGLTSVPASTNKDVAEASPAVDTPAPVSARMASQAVPVPETTTATDNLDDGGKFGDSSWYIDNGGVLHIGAGELGSASDPHWKTSPHFADITSVQIDDGAVANANSSSLFSGLKGVTSIDGLNNLDTSKVTSMSGMFQNTLNLKSLDLSNWDTSNVTDMNYMFGGMSSLENVNLSSFDTSKVTDMGSMFIVTYALKKLDLSSFNTKNVTTMSGMFSGPDPGNVHSMSMEEIIIDPDKFNTSNVTNMISMFYNLPELKSIDVSKFNTSKVTNVAYMFNSDISLKSLDLSSFDTHSLAGNTTNTNSMFYGTNLYKIKLGENTGLSDASSVPTGSWQAVGTGTENNPNGQKMSATGIEAIYSAMPAVAETYVRTVNGTLTVPTSYSDKADTGNITASITGVSGNTFDKVITVPAVAGYTPYKNGTEKLVADADGNYTASISGMVNGANDFTTSDSILYKENPQVATGTLKIPTVYNDNSSLNGFLEIPEVSGVYGSTNNPVDISSYPIPSNYTTDTKSVTFSVDADGHISTANIINYTRLQAKNNLTVKTTYDDGTPNGEITIPNVTGSYGSTISDYDISAYTSQDGYSTTDNTIPISIDSQGNMTTTGIVNYTKNALATVTADVTIKSNQGDQVAKDVTGTVGETKKIDVPTIAGYTADKNQVEVTINSNGTITVNDPDKTGYVTYTKDAPATVKADVTIKSNQGDQVVKDVTGTVGETKKIDVPTITGYTADKKQVAATVTADGITVNDPDEGGAGYVTYTKKSTSNGGGSSTTTPTESITDVDIDVATFADQPAAKLYDANGNQVTNRALKPNTGWYADKKLSRNGISYYRVASGEWVKMDDVYVYTPDNEYIETYNDSSKTLLNAHQKEVGRQLRPNSNWITDVYTYMNGIKYYRVASNEFVSANDAFEYTPISAVVQTNDSNTTVYDERGNAVTNRQLAANSSWKSDKTAVINGLTMHRVATNEWVRAVDVSNVKEF